MDKVVQDPGQILYEVIRQKLLNEIEWRKSVLRYKLAPAGTWSLPYCDGLRLETIFKESPGPV